MADVTLTHLHFLAHLLVQNPGGLLKKELQIYPVTLPVELTTHSSHLTPTSAVAESDDFLCDNRAPTSNTKKRRFRQSVGCSCYISIVPSMYLTALPEIKILSPRSTHLTSPPRFDTCLANNLFLFIFFDQ